MLSWSSRTCKVTCNCSLLRQKGRTQTKVKPIKIPKPPNEGSWFCFHWLQVSSASKNIIMSFEEDGPSACQSRRNCIQKHFNRSVIELCGHRMVWVAKCTFIIFFSTNHYSVSSHGSKKPNYAPPPKQAMQRLMLPFPLMGCRTQGEVAYKMTTEYEVSLNTEYVQLHIMQP